MTPCFAVTTRKYEPGADNPFVYRRYWLHATGETLSIVFDIRPANDSALHRAPHESNRMKSNFTESNLNSLEFDSVIKFDSLGTHQTSIRKFVEFEV